MNNLVGYAQQFLGKILMNNLQQNLLDVPWKDAAIQAIQSGDQKTGQQLAQNILQSYGFSSPEEAVRQGIQNLSGNQ